MLSLIGIKSFAWTCGQWEIIGGKRQCDAKDLDDRLHLGHIWKITQGKSHAKYLDGSFTFFHPARFQCTCTTQNTVGTTVQTEPIIGSSRIAGAFIVCPATSGGTIVV